jgi:hypothetical protein
VSNYQNIKMQRSKFSKQEYAHYSREHSTRKFSSPEEEEEKYSSITTKKCSKCGEVKFLTCFEGNTSGRDGFTAEGYRLRRGECSECRKMAGQGLKNTKRIAKSHGISYKAPEGTCCAICNKPHKRIVFDHCHKKEVFRGYLCDPCNRSMGVLGDNIEGLLRCINYLQITEQKVITQESSGKLKIIN